MPEAILNTQSPRFVCIGGAVIDRKLRSAEPIRPGTSNPVVATLGFGGVARNVAENLARLGGKVSLASCVGDDASGRALLAHLAEVGVDVAAVEVIKGASTAEYTALLQPDGMLFAGGADMAILDRIHGDLAKSALSGIVGDAWIFADCNASTQALADMIRHCAQAGLPLAIDAISVAKARRLPRDLAGVACLFLNRAEAAAVLGQESGDPATMARMLVARGPRAVVLTLGEAGALLCEGQNLKHVPAEPAHVADVTGAGDAMIAGTLFGYAGGLAMPDAVKLGTHIAARTVASASSVDDLLTPRVAQRFVSSLPSLQEMLPS